MVSLEVRFYTLSCNLEKNNFFTENVCLFFLGTAKCTYLYCSKFSLLEFGLTARYAYENDLICSFMDYVYDGSYCVAVLSS